MAKHIRFYCIRAGTRNFSTINHLFQEMKQTPGIKTHINAASMFDQKPIIGVKTEDINSSAGAGEVKFFGDLKDQWWDLSGKMRPLHRMNQIRVPFVRDGLIKFGPVQREYIESSEPLKNLNILDVGCGGGILTETLARLGPNIVGLDPTPEMIEVAVNHAQKDSSLKNLSYVNTTIEKYALRFPRSMDAVIASEVVEHVYDKQLFIKACCDCLKPGGSIFLTTFNKTVASNVLGIWVAEYVANLVPKGTHQWEKFIEPHKLQAMLEENKCSTKLVHGTFYNMLTENWSFISNTSVHYALHAVKDLEPLI